MRASGYVAGPCFKVVLALSANALLPQAGGETKRKTKKKNIYIYYNNKTC